VGRRQNVDITDVENALTQAPGLDTALRVLRILLPTGVADMQQLQRATGMSRSQVYRLLERFQEVAGDALLARVPFNVPRPGARGRSPGVYTLGEVGAALLRRHSHPHARACALKEAAPIAHARATLDVHLAAREAGLAVVTEKELPYGEGKVIRPDNLVTLPDGTKALFETEQAASLPLLRRIVKGLRNKVAFFDSDAARGISPTVRVLFHVAPGKAWQKTLATWQRALAVVVKERGASLPFRLAAMPLADFLERPDWTEPPASERWTWLEPAAGERREKRSEEKADLPVRLPRGLKRRSARDDRLILLAFWQHFREHAPTLGGQSIPRPDPAFFQVMEVIYLASHDEDAAAIARTAYPHASVYLLGQYLRMHPALCQALNKAITRGGYTMRWNVTTILHRMQVVIRTFLRYHGWEVSPTFMAYPTVTSWEVAGPRDVAVEVRLRPELLMTPDEGVVTREDVQRAERALAWVLWALFAYAEQVGVKRAVFW